MICGSLSNYSKCCLHHSMISDGSFKIIPVLSLQAAVYDLNSFLISFTNQYILLLSFSPCSFSTCFICSSKYLFLSMESFLYFSHFFNTLNPELNPTCYLLALLGAHHFLHVSRIRVKLLTFRRLMSHIYIYMEHPFLMFLDHTQRRSTVGRTPLDE